ncbi:MAG: signal peptidase II [Candidatus Neomarinimicrobiota bacterium]|jgi:signal peptidase II|nr:signal peptidase II [Candidatus Neomarinimicrobiota bacterium]MEC7901525.1 signal peptidase II [Candidatus Neomarinimicrobiota bacterium]MED5248266.1 signal peptidase II [Candidatus Neomarinimicrobiota bacterium]|tara:strand:- start:193 stop:663 length:471 start_codon:yes stop_codon:yes gene_type:complete
MKVLFVSAILVLADQISKTIVVKTMSLYESIPVIQNFFHFTYITNDGMAFGINFPFGYYIFTSVSVLLTLFLFWYLWSVRTHSIVIRLGISFIIAGAIGNLIDRIFLGAVIDFLDFMIGNFHWYVFNLADSYVTVGMVLVLVDSIILEKKRESAHS